MTRGPDLADWLRWTGLVCELTGLAITAAGIGDLRRRYSDRPGVVRVVDDARDPQWRQFDAARDEVEQRVPGVDYGMTYANDPTAYYYWVKRG